WSMTVVMKIDLAGPERRGLALGLNEAAGYLGVAATAFVTGVLAADFAPRTVVWTGAAAIAALGLLLTVAWVRDTAGHVAAEQVAHVAREPAPGLIRSCSQAGLVNNLNDALAWGLVPLYLAAHGASVREIGLVVGALIAGIGADLASARAAILAVAVLSAISGLLVAATRWRPAVPGGAAAGGARADAEEQPGAEAHADLAAEREVRVEPGVGAAGIRRAGEDDARGTL